MRRIINAISIIFATLIIASCSKSDVKDEISFLCPSDISRFLNASKLFAKQINDNGYHCTIYNAKGNDALQLEQAREAIRHGAKSICVAAVNGNSAAAIIRECKNAGVPIVAYNRLINNCDLDCFVAGDIKKLAEMMVNEALRIKPTGNYYIICGDRFDINGLSLRNNIDKLLEPHVKSGDINIVYRNFTENWDAATSAREFGLALNLSGKKPDAILAGYDGMSRAIIEEVKKYYGSVDGIVVTGQDAELESIKSIVAGEQTMTAYHPVKAEAEKCAEVAIAMAKGTKIQGITGSTFNGQTEVPTIHISSILVNKSNIDDIIIKGGVFTEEEVYE